MTVVDPPRALATSPGDAVGGLSRVRCRGNISRQRSPRRRGWANRSPRRLGRGVRARVCGQGSAGSGFRLSARCGRVAVVPATTALPDHAASGAEARRRSGDSAFRKRCTGTLAETALNSPGVSWLAGACPDQRLFLRDSPAWRLGSNATASDPWSLACSPARLLACSPARPLARRLPKTPPGQRFRQPARQRSARRQLTPAGNLAPGGKLRPGRQPAPRAAT
jgi:hypothetical protein